MINQASILFILITAGSIATLFGQWIQLTLDVPMSGAALPCICIVIYVFLNHLKKYQGTTRIQVGENTYFMGFIFTLVSLVVALVKLNGNSTDIDSVLANAGVAFITTLVAITLRLLIIQRGISLGHARQRAEEELLIATDSYSHQLKKTTEKLRTDHQDQVDALQTVFQTSIDALKNNVGALNDNFMASAESFRAAASKTGSRLEHALLDLNIPENILTDRLNPAITSLQESIHGVNASLQMYTNGTMRSSQTMEKVAKASNQYALDIARICSETADIVKNVKAGTGQMIEIQQGLQNIVTLLETMAVQIKNADQSTDTLHDRVQTMQAPVHAISDSLNRAAHRARQLNKDMDNAVLRQKKSFLAAAEKEAA